MAGKDPYENTWADQWDTHNKTGPTEQKQEEGGKEGKKMMPKKLEEGLNKTKEGATKGFKKVKDGASVGLFWIKDKCTNKK